MSIVLKFDHINNTTEPILYIDSIIEDGYVNEMITVCIRHIREEINKTKECKRENLIALNEKDISSKEDGYWYVIDNKNVILYKKTTQIGYIYSSSKIQKLYTFSYKKCIKVVPQVFETQSKYDHFVDELKLKVNEYKCRSFK